MWGGKENIRKLWCLLDKVALFLITSRRIIIQLLLIWVYIFLQKAPRPCRQSKLILSFILVRDSFVVVGGVLNESSLREASQVFLFAGDWRWVSGGRWYRKPPMKRDST